MFGINEKCQGLEYSCQKNAKFLKHINAEVFILQMCVLIDLKHFFFLMNVWHMAILMKQKHVVSLIVFANNTSP